MSIIITTMATLLRLFRNPNFYRRLPLPIASVISMGLLGYCIHKQQNTIFPSLQKLFQNISLQDINLKQLEPAKKKKLIIC